MSATRHPVEVRVKYSATGVKTPLHIKWPDGRIFETRVKSVGNLASEAGGAGQCFVVKVEGRHLRKLFYAHDYERGGALTWFVESGSREIPIGARTHPHMDGSGFIEVIADYRVDGEVIPVSVVVDEQYYDVDEIVRITPMTTTKSGGRSMRYDLIICGRPHCLYFEGGGSYDDVRRWYETPDHK